MTYEQMKAALFAELPRPEDNAAFRFAGVYKMSHPHPYCITGKHVQIASDMYNGSLGRSAIEYAEALGVSCGMEGCRAKFDEHITVPAVVVVIKGERSLDLNNVLGLHAYLLGCKPVVEKITGDKGGWVLPTEDEVREGKITVEGE